MVAVRRTLGSPSDGSVARDDAADGVAVAEKSGAERSPAVPFDSSSLLWQLMADPRPLLLYGPAVAALQGAHPVVAAGVFEHSTVFENPVGRVWRSGDAVLRWVYGGERALEEARVLREIHRDVQGFDFDGHRYHALQAEPFAWVWATGWLPVINGLRLFWHEPVTPALEDQLYDEFKNLGRIIGVRERLIPPTIEAFDAYWDAMLEQLATGHEKMLEGVELFTRPPRPHRLVPQLLWWPFSITAGRATCFLLATGSPPQMRDLLAQHAGYEWSEGRQRAARVMIKGLQLANLVPRGVRRLPEHLLVRVARRSRYLTTGPPALKSQGGCPAGRTAAPA